MTEAAAELPISEARENLAGVVSRAHYAGRDIYVTRIVPADLAEAIERAEDAIDVEAARVALARLEAGESPVSLTDLRKELGL
ncbi:prevent-host-death protein [Micromonospora chalcea]|uniref:prevent-host-death protein n=1 Tax=Micromonospora chalcea TaxID=1874 RepID=UPI0037A4A037